MDYLQPSSVCPLRTVQCLHYLRSKLTDHDSCFAHSLAHGSCRLVACTVVVVSAHAREIVA